MPSPETNCFFKVSHFLSFMSSLRNHLQLSITLCSGRQNHNSVAEIEISRAGPFYMCVSLTKCRVPRHRKIQIRLSIMQMHELELRPSRSRMTQVFVAAYLNDSAGKRRRSSLQNLVLVVGSIVLVFVTYQAADVEARYLHPENYRVGRYRDFQGAEDSMPPFRRQDFDDSNGASDADDDSDDGDDQSAAASYRNQDDSGNQDGARTTDGFDDNEPDGPYEETPVEQEGQADLERFFDDHLGASDRDGMDKENLPTNLIATLSEPPQLNNFGPQVLTAAPTTRIDNPFIEPPRDSTLAVLPTIQTTSFIRLPDEKKLIVTNQITRNTIGGPVKYADGNDDNGRQSALLHGATSDHEAGFESAAPTSSSDSPSSEIRNDPTSVSLNIELDPSRGTRQQRQQQQQLSSALSALDNQAGQQDARDDKLTPRGSEVVITEDDDDDRIYVTNATDKPFKIDALGGFDPEADFQDAAQDLDVVSEKRQRAASRRPIPAVSKQSRDEEDPEGSNVDKRQESAPNRYEFAFHESPESDMYEDASETDEVTFGQDDPYQTDLEAEMRHQQYDRVGTFMAEDPAKSGSSNVARDSRADSEKPEEASDSKESTDFNRDDGVVDPNDDDAEIDSDYKPLKPQVRKDTSRVEPRRREMDDTEEGNWVNDGADEMDIPSQSHQNFILDKAAKHDAMVRKAALDEMDAAKKQQEQPTDESGRTSSDGEESQRMPNADYLKEDLKIEDDSGYAA